MNYEKTIFIVILTGIVLIGNGILEARNWPYWFPQRQDLNLIFKYGVGAKNELNTFKNTYTKDMVVDLPITINLTLSDQEIETIYTKMKAVNFFNFPQELPTPRDPNALITIVTPCDDFYLKVISDSGNKEYFWDNCGEKLYQNFSELDELSNLIQDIIQSRTEFQELPEPRGGYT